MGMYRASVILYSNKWRKALCNMQAGTKQRSSASCEGKLVLSSSTSAL